MSDRRVWARSVPSPEIAIVGGGPAGLSAAIVARELGRNPLIIDDNPRLGGQLIKQTHKFFGSKSHYCGVRGIDVATKLAGRVAELGIETLLSTDVIGYYSDGTLAAVQNDNLLELHPQRTVVATGAAENALAFPNNDLPGVYGAGAVQTLMNVHGVRPGRRVLMVGSGNIGLIVSYQLIQAGIEVAAVVEALPRIGGYQVHASKLVRLGVPILVEHTVKEALGTERVESAVICGVKGGLECTPGTEQELDVDTICIAVGLSPLSELLWQAGCKMVYVPELGGHVAWHNAEMVTSIPSVFVAGDLSGIEEASTAMLEGRIAGASAAKSLGAPAEDADRVTREAQRELDLLRQSPFGEKPRLGKSRLWT